VFYSNGHKDGLDKGNVKIKWSIPEGLGWSPWHQEIEIWTRRRRGI